MRYSVVGETVFYFGVGEENLAFFGLFGMQLGKDRLDGIDGSDRCVIDLDEPCLLEA